MTSNSVKVRSIILSALMVFSVFAGTVALTGSAVAAGNNPGEGPDIASATHYNQSSNGAGDGTAVLEVAFNEDVNYGTITDSDTEVFLQADGQRVDVIQSGSASLESGFAVRTAANGQLVVDTGDSVYNEVDNVTITNFDDNDGETTDSVTADVTFSPATVDVQEDGTPTNSVSDATVEAYRGSNVSLVSGTSTDVTFNIAGDDNNVDRNRGTGPNSETYNIDTDSLELGDYYVTSSTGLPAGQEYNVTLELQDLGLTVDSDSSTFDSNEDIEGTVETNDINRAVDIELVDDSGDTEEEITRNTGADGEVDYTFSVPSDDWDAGNYTVNVTDQNTQVTEESDEFEVVDVGDETASFGSSTYSEARGDIVNVTILFDNTDTATVQFGDYEDDNYNITAEVVDDDEDGEAYVEFNTFLAGNSNRAGEVLSIGGDDDELNNITQGGPFTGSNQPAGSDVLEDSDYDILVEAGEKDANVVTDEDNVATLTLSERSTDSANIWTAPADDYDDLADTDAEGVVEFVEAGNLTQTGTIAQDDVMVVEISANGLEGAFDDTSEYQTVSGQAEVFSLAIEEDSTAANAQTDQFNVSDLSSENVSVIYADTEGAGADTHYVVINSDAVVDGAGAVNFNHEDGDSYVANFTVWDNGAGNGTTPNFDSDLADESVSVTDSAAIEDREVDVDTNADDFVVLEAADGQEVTGDTNLAPGTELTIRLRSDGAAVPFLKQPETIVQSDGTFTTVANFTAENAGGNFTVQPRVNSEDIGGDYDGYLVEATEEPEPTTEEPTDAGTATEEPTAPPTDEPTEEQTTEEQTTEMEMTEEETTMDSGTATAAEETTTGGSGPGFTAAIALIALIAAALLAVRRDN